MAEKIEGKTAEPVSPSLASPAPAAPALVSPEPASPAPASPALVSPEPASPEEIEVKTAKKINESLLKNFNDDQIKELYQTMIKKTSYDGQELYILKLKIITDEIPAEKLLVIPLWFNQNGADAMTYFFQFIKPTPEFQKEIEKRAGAALSLLPEYQERKGVNREIRKGEVEDHDILGKTILSHASAPFQVVGGVAAGLFVGLFTGEEGAKAGFMAGAAAGSILSLPVWLPIAYGTAAAFDINDYLKTKAVELQTQLTVGKENALNFIYNNLLFFKDKINIRINNIDKLTLPDLEEILKSVSIVRATEYDNNIVLPDNERVQADLFNLFPCGIFHKPLSKSILSEEKNKSTFEQAGVALSGLQSKKDNDGRIKRKTPKELSKLAELSRALSKISSIIEDKNFEYLSDWNDEVFWGTKSNKVLGFPLPHEHVHNKDNIYIVNTPVKALRIVTESENKIISAKRVDATITKVYDPTKTKRDEVKSMVDAMTKDDGPFRPVPRHLQGRSGLQRNSDDDPAETKAGEPVQISDMTGPFSAIINGLFEPAETKDDDGVSGCGEMAKLISDSKYTNVEFFNELKKDLNGEPPCYDVVYHASEDEKIAQAKIIIPNLFLNNLPDIGKDDEGRDILRFGGTRKRSRRKNKKSKKHHKKLHKKKSKKHRKRKNKKTHRKY